MKTKLLPLALLIPAVVLAQSAPPAAQSLQDSGAMQSQQMTPPNPTNASTALNNAKQKTTALKGQQQSKGDGGNLGCTESATIMDSGC